MCIQKSWGTCLSNIYAITKVLIEKGTIFISKMFYTRKYNILKTFFYFLLGINKVLFYILLIHKKKF